MEYVNMYKIKCTMLDIFASFWPELSGKYLDMHPNHSCLHPKK